MKKNTSYVGIAILLVVFLVFYVITVFFLEEKELKNNVINNTSVVNIDDEDYENEKQIVGNLYKNVRMLYDVVNSKFKVDQNDVIVMGDITYKKITNFNEITNDIFTLNGKNKYIKDLQSYFAYTDDGYYLAGNLVSYQTYYFRGDKTNIYILNVDDNEIKAIIYENWTSNNKNTLATVKVVMENGSWLIDNIDILSTE